MLMIIGASAQVPVRATLAASRSLGHLGAAAWAKAVFPRSIPQIRLPVYAVLAFSLSAVDVGLILAPGNPPPLAVLAARWFSDYDLALYLPGRRRGDAAARARRSSPSCSGVSARSPPPASAGSGSSAGSRGRGLGRRPDGSPAAPPSLVGILGLLGSLAVMGLWSLAGSWRFPDACPDRWSAAIWMAQAAAGRADRRDHGRDSASFPRRSRVLLSLACLENEARRGVQARPPGALAPLRAPARARRSPSCSASRSRWCACTSTARLLAVAWTHLVFVLPYAFLSLADPFRALDPRYAMSAAALGASPARVFLTLKLPMLLRPILIAAAVGFAVSVGQYLATLFRRRGPGRDAHHGGGDARRRLRPAGHRRLPPCSRRPCRSSPTAPRFSSPAPAFRHRRGLPEGGRRLELRGVSIRLRATGAVLVDRLDLARPAPATSPP